MQLEFILSLFVLFFIISVPSAFADVTIIPADGSGAPGCEINSGCFIPNVAIIDVGETVTFSNTDSAAHTFTAGTPGDGPTGEFDTSMVMAGNYYRWNAFDVSGQIDYFCMVHPWMIGTIIVNEDNSNYNPSPPLTPPPVSYPPRNHSADITIERDTSSPGCERGNDCYDPYRFSTQVGNTVEWYNADSAAHTVTSGSAAYGPDGAFDSSMLMSGESFFVTFRDSGTYDYFCMVHPWMEGVINVEQEETVIPKLTSFKKYTDPQGRYSIDIPRGWDSDYDGDNVFFFDDINSWSMMLTIFPVDDFTFTSFSTSESVLKIMEKRDREFCRDLTFSQDGKICYDHEIVSSGGGDKVGTASIASTFTSQYESYTSEEYDTISVTSWYFGENSPNEWHGNNPWELYVETDADWAEQNLTPLITKSIHTFKVLKTSNPISEPNPVSTNIVYAADGSGAPGCEENFACYEPYAISVKTGTTVTFSNTDSAAHTFSSGTPEDGPTSEFDSSMVMSGNSFSHTFNKSGTFDYFCMVHPWMVGVVEVYGSNIISTPTPAPEPILQSDVELKIGKTSYTSGDAIFYSGKVTNAKPGSDVTITLTSPNNRDVVAVDQLSIGRNGEFRSSFETGGPLWSNTGMYTLKVQYGSMAQDSVQFKFKNSSVTPVTPTPTITSGKIDVYTDTTSYSPGSLVSIRTSTASNANVAISVSDFDGNNIVTRTVTTDSSGNGSVQFKLPSSAKSGTYVVDATATVSGKKLSDASKFTVSSNSLGNITIVSLSPTDQQGNSVSSFTKGKLGFVNVVLESDARATSLVTINLFDSQLTSLGIGSFKTTLNSGQSEMSLSFFIPNDAEFGSGDIYANVFSDWPSQGGVPLTGESATKVRLQ